MASRSRRGSSPAPRQTQALRHRIALLGSSGGSTLRASAIEEFKALASRLSQLPACAIVAMSFVEASVPLDHAADDEPAALWTLDAAGAPVCRTHGALAAVNREARTLDAEMAQHMSKAKDIDALVLVSAHLAQGSGVHTRALRAAIECRTPCLGSGGVSLGMAVDAGARLLQQSGSVSTNAESRAIAASAALARHWKLHYTPRLPAADLSVMPVLDAVLPLILALALLHALASHAATERLAVLLHATSTVGIPTALAAVASRRAAQLGESGLLSGLLAGAVTAAAGAAAGGVAPSADSVSAPLGGIGGMLAMAGEDSTAHASSSAAALVAGFAAGLASRRALAATHAAGLPATASTLLTVSGAGVLGGAIGAVLVPPAAYATALVRVLLTLPFCAAGLPWAVRAAIGGAAGVLTKYGSIHGFYHGVHFPLILIQMREGAVFSLLGAFDACCLCCVCAGVCAAVALTSPSADEAHAARRAVAINLGLGDFGERPRKPHAVDTIARPCHCPRIRPTPATSHLPLTASFARLHVLSRGLLPHDGALSWRQPGGIHWSRTRGRASHLRRKWAAAGLFGVLADATRRGRLGQPCGVSSRSACCVRGAVCRLRCRVEGYGGKRQSALEQG